MARWKDTEAALARIGAELRHPSTLTVIGSIISMSLGQDERSTDDVDIWDHTSKFDEEDLRQACEKAGVDFNPDGYIAPEKLYVQLVTPGIVQLGKFKGATEVLQFGNLKITRPPIENIVASKMVRGEPKDYDDSVFLIHRCQLDKEKIRAAINSIEDDFSKDTAMENFDVMCTLLEYESCAQHTQKRKMRH